MVVNVSISCDGVVLGYDSCKSVASQDFDRQSFM